MKPIKLKVGQLPYKKNLKHINLKVTKGNASEAAEQITPTSNPQTFTAPTAAIRWGQPQLTSTEEKLTRSNPVEIVEVNPVKDGSAGTTIPKIESPQIQESQSPAEINAPVIIYTLEQATVIINDLALKLASTEAKLNEALGAASTIQQAAPTTMGGKAMAFLNSPVLATIADGITKMLQAPAGDPILEQIKNQLLMQKLGILLPATPEKVVVQ